MKQYLCIDLKSFYASVECVERGMDPMTTHLVVADPDRSDKTICLAVTPALKALGVKNRCRVFEIPPGIDYIIAVPRMKKYIDYAAKIYGVYLSFIAKEDIHVYSIDEAFFDVTDYLSLYQCDARTLAKRMMQAVLDETGIRATAGIGTNLYLAKIALDITAKHAPDFIGELTEESYRATMWQHRPLTDFWRVGHGIARKLEDKGIFTMADIAAANEDLLYRWFGIDAELLIDHAWGREPTTIADIKNYQSKTNCLSSGQVLMRDYTFEEAGIIVKEMTDELCLEMVRKQLVTDSLTLFIGYAGKETRSGVHGTAAIATLTNGDRLLVPAVTALYEKITDRNAMIRRVNITCNRVVPEGARQMTFFDDEAKQKKNKKAQNAVLNIKDKFGKNAILKGVDLEDAATAQARNRQIGGHKSGE